MFPECYRRLEERVYPLRMRSGFLLSDSVLVSEYAPAVEEGERVAGAEGVGHGEAEIA